MSSFFLDAAYPQKLPAAPAAIPYSSSLQDKGGENKLTEAVAFHSTISWLLYHAFCPGIRAPARPLLGTLSEKKNLSFLGLQGKSTKEGKLFKKQGRERIW